jgi:hypothetical protein
MVLRAAAFYCSAEGSAMYAMFCHGDQLTQAKVGKNPQLPICIRVVFLHNHSLPFVSFGFAPQS